MFKKIVFYLLGAYALLGFIALPYFLKPQLIQIMEQETNSKVSIDSLSFNPFVFKLVINELELKTLDNKKLLSFGSLLINVEPTSLLNATVHLKEMTLAEPKIFLVYNKDKTFNALSILKEKKEETSPETENSATMPRVKVDKISIVDGSLSYEDFTRKSKFDFVFDKIGFSLKDIDTNDFNSSDAQLRFHSTLGDGGFVDLRTRVLGFKPFIAEGSLDFEASKLYTQWRYMKDSLNLEVADGKLSFHSEYRVNLEDLNSTTIDNVNVNLDGLRIKPKEKYKDVLNLDSFYISDMSIKPMQKSVLIAKMGLDSLSIKASRNKNGEIDWLEYVKVSLPDSNETEIEEKQDKKSEPWNVTLQELSLEKIKVDFKDVGVSPQVNTSLNDFNLYAQNITLAGKEPFAFQMNSLLNDKFKCSVEGDVVHNVLNANASLKCEDFNIVHYRPYIDEIARDSLKKYNVKLIRATAGFDAKINAKEIDEEIAIDVQNANFKLEKFALNKRSDSRRLVNFSSFGVKDLSLNTKRKTLNVANVSLNGLDVKTARLKDGSLNVEELIVPKVVKKSKKAKSKKKEKDYRVKVKRFSLNAARVGFEDKFLEPSVKSKLDRINFHAYNVDSKEKSWMTYSFSSRVNSKGYIKSKGSLSHAPLKQKGTFSLQDISLKEINPYIEAKTFAELDDGFLNVETETQYSQSTSKPDLTVNGALQLKNLFVQDSRTELPVLSFNEFALNVFTFEALPNRLFIDEANLHNFYVDALINEKKELNFALLAKGDANQSAEETQASDLNASAKKEEFPIKLLKLGIHNGSAMFADLSIPIQFRTHIHNLNGYVYSISSNPKETSYVDILGEIDEYGSTKLKGSVNSANPKGYTDLDLSFSNITLNSFSGYSATFAGHEIDGGKLYLDLGYKLNDSNIKGSNSVIVKQMELGKEIEDENVTSLPLGFVIALLEDSDGVIDIDMPVEGNVDAPDFKYGAFVFETFGNLLLKAVTSPFTFLGSMLGMDGDAMQYAEFEPGKTHITPPEREKLDQIAKMMTKRPKINLGISGSYDEEIDKRALQVEKLIALVLKESGAENASERKSAMTTDILEEIYEKVKDDDRLDKIEDALEKKYEGAEFDREYRNALIEENVKIQVVTLEELELLAKKRAQIVSDYLRVEKSIALERLNVLEVSKAEDSTPKSVRIKFEIEVK